MDIRIEGADQLKRLAAAAKEAGRNDLRKELLADFRKNGKPVVEDVKASAAETLPRSGGLAGIVAASKITVRTRTGGKQVGVRITGAGAAPLKRLNAGNLRHPLFGDRQHWYGQNVRAGWFDRPIEKHEAAFRGGCLDAIDRVGRKLEESA